MRILLVAVEGIEPPSVASSALMPALPAPAEGAQPARARSHRMDANPGRLTNSPARTDVALLIRRAVRPTKGAHPLRNPLSRVQTVRVAGAGDGI